MRVLFWNTHNNVEINPVLSDIILENDINLVLLAEYQADVNELISNLHQRGCHMKKCLGCNRLTVLSDISELEPGTQDDYYSFQLLPNNLIVCCVHLPSKIYGSNSEARKAIINRMNRDVKETEINNNTENTVIVGDFNLDPFENECISVNHLNSIPFCGIARNDSRTIAGESFKMFYNPMWRFLGDYQKPFGTLFYHGTSGDNIYWHIFDQVMIRPCLRPRFVDESLQIITDTVNCSLVDRKGYPDVDRLSDHLPITFEIQEEV